MSARMAALKVLERYRRDGAWSDSVLDGQISAFALDQRDAALSTRLCYGVIQNQTLLDFYIDFMLTSGMSKLEPKVLDILRLSAYQILFMDKIPDSAAVNEGVALCKRFGISRASGLVNAVLRRLSRSRDTLPDIPRGDLAKYLSVKYSHPLWLAQLMIDEHGGEFAEAFFAANNEPAPVTVRINILKTGVPALMSELAESGVGVREHPWLLGSAELFGAGSIAALPAFVEGRFYVQDAAASTAVLVSGAASGMSVLDACAAPGGKSFAAAILMKNSGRIMAGDIHENKLGRIADGAKRLGIDIIETIKADARTDETTDLFDVVIADVPCSGLGVIRKKPEIRWKSPGDIAGLPQIQYDILSAVAAKVKPGGVLIYSTCTVLSEENDAVVDRFLESNVSFYSEDFDLPYGGKSEKGRITLWPNVHGTDGFFICRLRRDA